MRLLTIARLHMIAGYFVIFFHIIILNNCIYIESFVALSLECTLYVISTENPTSIVTAILCSLLLSRTPFSSSSRMAHDNASSKGVNYFPTMDDSSTYPLDSSCRFSCHARVLAFGAHLL